jgi:type VI secretion system secreted protein VgrG
MATTQAQRTIKIKTPLAADALLLSELRGREAVSQLFEYDLQMLSESGDLNADDVLGRPLTVQFELPGKRGTRFFNGFVTEFAQTGYEERFHLYRATLRPWFWFLTRSSDCRIFQKKSVAEIFQAVVKPYGFNDFKLKLGGSYPSRDYCVQYRETDFNFLSRLLEEEGIHYFFEHEDGKHFMVLADNDANAHGKVSGYESVPYFPPTLPIAQRDRDHLVTWGFSKTVRPGHFATTDYDFTAPKKALLETATIARKNAHADFEVYDYPAELSVFDASESKRLAKVRIQELQATQMIAQGGGDAAGLATGRTFALAKYPRADLNIEYFIVSSNITLSSDSHRSGATDDQIEFEIGIEAIDAKTPFNPSRMTPKPLIQGAQTAVVVGKAGEEIYTDQYGRVKVQFFWDREGKKDENSGCWIRVSQLWAGKQWGAMHIPRIGQEVIVSFLEGDPDQPIITGRVYNGANMPPYDLPANMTQSGIKSRSSKDGTADNFNEIRFEDKKGSELLTVHAEKDQSISVENDESHTVGHDRTKSVKNDETVSVGHNRTESVGNNESISITSNRDESVGGNETVAIDKSRSLSVGKDQSISISSNRTLSVGKDESITVGGKRQDQVGKDEEVTIGKNRKVSIGENDSLAVGKKLIVEAADEITLTTGDASITMKKDGTVTIKGKDITLEGSGKINVKASGDVVIKGSKVSQN